MGYSVSSRPGGATRTAPARALPQKRQALAISRKCAGRRHAFWSAAARRRFGLSLQVATPGRAPPSIQSGVEPLWLSLSGARVNRKEEERARAALKRRTPG